MRNLTKKQIKMLDKWIDDTEKQKPLFDIGKKNLTPKDIPFDLWERIDDVNPCEIFYQNVCRYLDDYNWK